MISVTTILFFTLKVLRTYRSKLELFQIFLRDFKETPRSRLVKKFLVEDPIMEDEEGEESNSFFKGRAIPRQADLSVKSIGG